MAEPLIKYDKANHVAVFTLDRPAAMNAVSPELAQRFEQLMDGFEGALVRARTRAGGARD